MSTSLPDHNRRWIVVLGASSGFGAAAAQAFAKAGYDVFGIHLDRRSAMPRVQALVEQLEATGRQVRFFNGNAADDRVRQAIVDEMATALEDLGGKVYVMVHSLAFGSLQPFVPPPGATGRGVRRRQLEMTLDVMANSLVYWTQDLVARDMFGEYGRIFAMTSSGSHSVWPEYGPVSAAKAALESHVRQLCRELAPRAITVNAVLAGVTRTPALTRIPGHEVLVDKAISKNPHNRLTTPEDVAACLVELARPGTYWLTGNTLRVDGGEDVCA